MKKANLVFPIVMYSLLLAIPSISQAGLMDSLQNLQNAMSRVNSTTDQAQGTQSRFAGLLNKFSGNTATNQAQNSQIETGKVFLPKINNISLYQSPSKTGTVLRKLPKGTEMVYSGTMNNGFYMVTTEHGEGWVDSALVQ